VWIYGERVGKITEHPAFRNAARMLARLFDALHDPQMKPKLTVKSDAGHDTHAWFRVPYSAADQVRARDAIAEWARLTYGWMGRSPDYKAAFLGTLGANAEFYAPYQANALRCSTEPERVPFVSRDHPPAGGPRPGRATAARRRLRVERETIGASWWGQGGRHGSALTNYTFVAHHGISP
jgi:4-hydroxyphenylacetate 3-monooxygenase